MNKTTSQKIIGLALGVSLFAFCAAAEAQEGTKMSRVGVLVTGERNLERLRQGLRERGYIEGKNIEVVHRFAQGDTHRLPSLVNELLKLKPDVLIISSTAAIRAAQQATRTTPIIMMTNQDPVALGLIKSLAHPGGNLTGVVSLTRDLSGKRLELFKEAVPHISRVGILWVAPSALGAGNAMQKYQGAASALKLELTSLQVHRPTPDIDGALGIADKAQANALILVTNAVLNPHAKKVAEAAIRKRMPVMAERSPSVEAGALISYAADATERYRGVALYVDKILKGGKPADLPVQRARRFELVINLKTAKQISLTIPPNLLARADRVIR